MEMKNDSKFIRAAFLISAFSLYVSGFLAFIAIILWVVYGMKLMYEDVFPVVFNIGIGLTGLLFLSAVPIAISKNLRPASGALLVTASYILSFVVWFFSLIGAYYYAGKVWTIIGLLLSGIGVIPIAAISSFWVSDYSMTVQVIGGLFGALILRFVGFTLMETTKD